MAENINDNFEMYISPITVREWMKWLTYIPDFKKRELERINKKNIDELSCEELEVILESKKDEKMLDLLNKFNSNTIKEDEYREIKNYIDNESIEDLMKSKLTDEELQDAMHNIKNYYYLSDKEIIKKVEREREEKVYNNLSMEDAYTFHLMFKVYYIIEMKKLDNQAYFSYEHDKPKTFKYNYFN